MKFSEQVFNLAESFMERPTAVHIDYKMVEQLAEEMLNEGRVVHDRGEASNINIQKRIILELVASSINYCYWYGRSDIRPNESNSGKMYELLYKSFDLYDEKHTDYIYLFIQFLKERLMEERFPLIEERIKHLEELEKSAVSFSKYVEKNYNDGKLEEIFKSLILSFPGFSSDMFLKRASLFFIELYRKLGWFENDLHKLHIPADYQIPNVLNSLKCISYDFALRTKVLSHCLIPKHSIEECEIRSATILVAKKLCELTEWNVSDVDEWLFTRRHDVEKPFHLTVTTDY